MQSVSVAVTFQVQGYQGRTVLKSKKIFSYPVLFQLNVIASVAITFQAQCFPGHTVLNNYFSASQFCF